MDGFKIVHNTYIAGGIFPVEDVWGGHAELALDTGGGVAHSSLTFNILKFKNLYEILKHKCFMKGNTNLKIWN